MAVMLVIAISQVGVWPHVPLGEYLYGLMRMGSVGIAGLKEFNGFDIGQIDAWVTWTLHYEWMFTWRCRYWPCSSGQGTS